MGFTPVLVYHSPCGREISPMVRAFARDRGLRIRLLTTDEEVVTQLNRSFPACIIIDSDAGEACTRLCRALKRDTFSAIVPVIFLLAGGDTKSAGLRALGAGADEVLTDRMDENERLLRLNMTLDRADRDVSVNPTTRLPGTVQIERDVAERMANEELFAMCYADLDHFKEFNDRYGYNKGDGVVKVLAHILRDVVKERAPTGFIGHIGGDDFIFNVPVETMRICCEEILGIFDELIPYQYNEEDRRAGYFLGKDRRGTIHRIPIMTLSIGVVTNQHRSFTHTAQVSELATEMKNYAKTLSGSVYAVDNRRESAVPALAGVPGAVDGIQTSPEP